MDRKFRSARVWSNKDLKKFSKLFKGEIINVSGWKDIDKEGERYKNYFSNASGYWISNYKAEARGFQGNLENEIYMDLEADLDISLHKKFDVVFNHTVLEHIFNIGKSFENLCELSKDIVIIVVPFLQEQHGEYGDYWRFTPLTIQKLFACNGLDLIYINYNDPTNESVYILAIGSRYKDKWHNIISDRDNQLNNINDFMLGTKIIKNSMLYNISNRLRKILFNLFR